MKITKRTTLIIILSISIPVILLVSIIALDRLFPSYRYYNDYLCDAAYSARCLDYLDTSEDQIRARMRKYKQTGGWTADDFKKFRTLIAKIQNDERKQEEILNQKDFLSEEERKRLDRSEKTKIYLERVLKILDELKV